MKDVQFDQTVNIKVAGVSKLALDQAVARLRASGRVRWKRKLVTKEAVVSALWMWIGDMDPAVVEEAMSRYVPHLEAILRNGQAPDEISGEPEAAQDQAGDRPRSGPRRRGGQVG